MNASNVSSIIARQLDIGDVGGDTTPALPVGSIVQFHHPYWGMVEAQYIRASGAISAQALCTLTNVRNSTLGYYTAVAAEVTDTANLGKSAGVAIGSIGDGKYGWVAISCSGLPVHSAASVAADTAIGIGGAGVAGAVSAGKQILNARNVAPATTTVAKAGCRAVKGGYWLEVPDVQGWFLGIVLSGTGIATGATVTEIDTDGRRVKMSAVTTASVGGTVTGTYNDGSANYFNVVQLNRSFFQGADAT